MKKESSGIFQLFDPSRRCERGEASRPARRRWLVTAAAVALSVTLTGCGPTRPNGDHSTQQPRNIIIMFADGTTFSQWSFGQYSSRVLRQQPFAVTDVVLREGVSGMLATHSADAYVTDSAAAASAMSTGHKVNNDAVSITPDGRAYTTLMRAAKTAGKRIGVVSTAQVYDATPAAFSVNAKSRRNYSEIVDSLTELEPDVLLGGGAEYFLPKGQSGGRRTDGKDVTSVFRAKGYAVVRDTAALNAASATKMLGLFAQAEMGFEIDRLPEKEPSTAEMTTAALKALSQAGSSGFVLLVENENTDIAQHENDAAALMHALWAFDEAVKVALDFQRRNPDTLVVVAGDHETGGIAPTYAPKDLSSMSSSNRSYAGSDSFHKLYRIRTSISAAVKKMGRKPTTEQLAAVVAESFPGFALDADLQALILSGKTNERNFAHPPHNMFGLMVARQTNFFWGTSGHTPQPAAVGAIGPGAQLFRGYQDNTDFGKHMHRLIGGR